MKEALKGLAKAAVTALITSDQSALAIEGGKLAIDTLFGWLPQKGKLEALIARVEGELAQLAEAEFKGRDDLEPAIGNATILFDRFGLTATELVDLGLKPDRVTEELLNRGKPVLGAAGEAVAGLCRGQIVPRVYELMLDDPQTIAELSPAVTRALLNQREAIDKIPDAVGLALRRMLGRHLVIDPTEIWRPELPDIYLLRAEYGVVPFHRQRRPDVKRLLAWCEDEARIAVRVMTGVGGTGKTRLMIELCRQARLRGWRAGFLHREVTATPSWELDGLVEGTEPLLLVVDYAETKRDVLVPVLRRLSLDHQSPRTRVILVARAVSDWLPDLRRADPKVQELLDETRLLVEALPAIAPPLHRRPQILEAAAAAFAGRLATAEVQRPRPSSAAVDLSAPHFANALLLHIAALAAVVGDPAKEEDALLRFVLVREERHWRNGLVSAKLSQDLDVSSVAQAVALTTLAGGVDDKPEARTLLERAPHLAALALPKRDRLIDMLHLLYPGERYLEPLQPDLLGEELVDRTLSRDPELLRAAFGDGVTGRQIQNGLTVLTRLAQQHPEAERWLNQLLAADLEQLVEPAIRTADAVGDPMWQQLAHRVQAVDVSDQHIMAYIGNLLSCLQQSLVGRRYQALFPSTGLINPATIEFILSTTGFVCSFLGRNLSGGPRFQIHRVNIPYQEALFGELMTTNEVFTVNTRHLLFSDLAFAHKNIDTDLIKKTGVPILLGERFFDVTYEGSAIFMNCSFHLMINGQYRILRRELIFVGGNFATALSKEEPQTIFQYIERNLKAIITEKDKGRSC